jgi:prolyl 4-hydroxylase
VHRGTGSSLSGLRSRRESRKPSGCKVYHLFSEALLIRYTDRQQFREHYDWFNPDKADTFGNSGNRASSFFVYLLADCKGGTTVFPKVLRPEAQEWCGILKCHDEDGQKVHQLEVQPKVGTAIFWHNLDPSGMVDMKTMHAGTPVINGTKIGLNIWTREKKFRN